MSILKDSLEAKIVPGLDLGRQTAADIVIVGGGMIGLHLAAHLCKASGRSVLVIEAGGANSLRHESERGSVEFPRVRDFSSSDDRYYGFGTGYKRRLGGRSLCWHGVCIPFDHFTLNKTCWPRGAVDSLIGNSTFGSHFGLQRRLEENGNWVVLDNGAAWLLSKLLPLGWSSRIVARAGKLVDNVVVPHNPLQDIRIRDYKSESQLQIATGVAAKFVMKGRRVRIGVRDVLTGRECTIVADRCILAANVFSNARVLLQSTGLKQLGGLTDHWVTGIVCVFRVDLCEHLVANTYLYYKVVDPDSGENLFNLFVETYRVGEMLYVDTWAMGVADFDSTSALHLRGNDLVFDGRAAAESVSRQMDSFDYLNRWARDICICYGLDFDSSRQFAVQNVDYLVLKSRIKAAGIYRYVQRIGACDHEAGIASLGTFCSDYGDVPGIGGLKVAGASLFPANSPANPSFTAMALSEFVVESMAL